MKYSKNKIYQFFKKLEDKINTTFSSKDIKNSFSNSFSNNNNSVPIYIPSEQNNKSKLNISVKNSRMLDLLKLFSDSFDNKEDDDKKSEQLHKKKEQTKKIKIKIKNKLKFTFVNSAFSRGDLIANNNIQEYQSLNPTQLINLDAKKKFKEL